MLQREPSHLDGRKLRVPWLPVGPRYVWLSCWPERKHHLLHFRLYCVPIRTNMMYVYMRMTIVWLNLKQVTRHRIFSQAYHWCRAYKPPTSWFAVQKWRRRPVVLETCLCQWPTCHEYLSGSGRSYIWLSLCISYTPWIVCSIWDCAVVCRHFNPRKWPTARVGATHSKSSASQTQARNLQLLNNGSVNTYPRRWNSWIYNLLLGKTYNNTCFPSGPTQGDVGTIQC
jgi:hypothetical protein